MADIKLNAMCVSHLLCPGAMVGQRLKGNVTSSIRANISGDILGITATAPKLSLNCDTFDAPVMTVLTLGLRAAHAIAI